MLPLSPSTAYTRNPTFITEEWNAYFADTAFNPASKVAGGWRGILYGNYACVNPKAAWDFFSASNFDMGWIDGGASRTWYLAYSASELTHPRYLLQTCWLTCSSTWRPLMLRKDDVERSTMALTA